jgi:hypothetical protein
MIDEIRKSINSTLYQRVTSPLYGTLALTWLIWNWKIWYLTLFVSEDKLSTTKLNFIVCNYSDPIFLVWLPLISTTLILTVVQFVSNGTYWLDLKFKTWRINQRNGIEGKQLLTLEQSIKLRTEIREQENTFDKLLEKRNTEIDILNKQIIELQNQLNDVKEIKVETRERVSESASESRTKSRKAKTELGSTASSDDYVMLSRNKELHDKFEDVAKFIRDKNLFPKDTPENVKEYFIANELVQADHDAMGNPIFLLTFRGRELYRQYYNKKYVK